MNFRSVAILPFHKPISLVSALALLAAGTAVAQQPYGLDTRPTISPYLNNKMPPKDGEYPLLLSQTGAFSNVATLTPATGVIPYTVNAPLWSDGTLKLRWMAVPNPSTIGFAPTGEWSFQNGTVFVKHFEIVSNENTGAKRRLETRLLVRDSDGKAYGVTYKWRADQTNADLMGSGDIPDGQTETLTIVTPTGTRTQGYTYPSRGDCMKCHSDKSNYVLGLKTNQLNGDLNYPVTGRTDNQLRALNHIGLFTPALNEAEIPTYQKTVSIDNQTAPIQPRIRSWLDSNCAHCHRPGGDGPGWDGRFQTPLSAQNLINNFVKFRDVGGSALHTRIHSLGADMMPPLAKNIVDEQAITVLRQWIASPLNVSSVSLFRDTTHLRVKYDRPVAAVALASSYALNQTRTVTAATIGTDPSTVILTTSPLTASQSYQLTVNDVNDQATSANTIWPNTMKTFTAQLFADLAYAASPSANPNPVAAGSPVTITVPIINDGAGDAAASTTRIQIKPLGSTTTTVEGSFATGALSGGGSANPAYSLTVPSPTAPGDYTAFITLDNTNTAGQPAAERANDLANFNFTVVLPTDTDGDGLSDYDEVNIYGTNPNLADTDGDGMNDGAEVRAGTDPNDPTSIFRIVATERVAPDGLKITWTAKVGKTYRVVRSPDLDFASPTIVAQDLPGVEPLTNHTDTTVPENTPRMFYRVEIQ